MAMNRILSGIGNGAVNLLARLPWGAMRALSTATCFVLYRVARYRRRVVRDNLAACFPELTSEQRSEIESDFYRNFCDNIFETVKLAHISDAEMSERMEFHGVEIIEELLASGRSVIAYFSHCFNWEWATSVTLHMDPNLDVAYGQIYRPLRNRWFDALMLRLRSRFGSTSIPKRTALRAMLEMRGRHQLSVTGFMSDQHPSHGDPTYVTTLLGRRTAMITGTETLGRRLGMAAVYWDMERTARGHYRITVRLLSADMQAEPPMAVTEAYTRMLETTIRRQPAIWLWTHKRWKHPVTTSNQD